MSWLSKFVSNPVAAVTDTAKGVIEHPLAIVQPVTWGTTAAATGGNKDIADKAVIAQSAGAVVLGGAAVAGAAGAGAGAAAGGSAVEQFGRQTIQEQLGRLWSAADHGATYEGAGTGDVTGGGAASESFNLDNAAPGIAVAALGIAALIALS